MSWNTRFKGKSRNAWGFPGQESANHCKYMMPVSQGHAEVTDKAGPAGSEPDQLSFIISICLSDPAGLDLMKCRLMVYKV